MIQDPNVEQYVQKRIEPLQEQIKELQASMFRLMQANNLHLQNVRLSFLEEVTKKWGESDIVEFDEWLYAQKNET